MKLSRFCKNLDILIFYSLLNLLGIGLVFAEWYN